MRCPTMRPTAARRRRGLTLVELLVTIALMLLIMSVIVGVFTSATEALTGAQKDQELASIARRLETVIQQDLTGATARFTPPLDPADNLGYFEYGENSFADDQGEDTDDYLAFTAKAPPGQPFIGRIMLPRGVWPAGTALAGQTRYLPATITSENAEIIYFLRHGNLYRRVLLVLPNQQIYADIVGGAYRFGPDFDGFSLTGANAAEVSWQGANDISVRPTDSIVTPNDQPPTPNSLGDLTNRHNRFARPRFTQDYNGDGAADDLVGFPGPSPDGVADYYPTFYPNNAAIRTSPLAGTLDTMAFPYVFPGAYRNAAAINSWINIGPYLCMSTLNPAGYLLKSNHSPLDVSDNLPIPTANAEYWNYWGFPTWAETRNINWTLANKRLPVAEFEGLANQQAPGMSRVRTANETLPPPGNWYGYDSGGAFFNPPVSAWQDDLIATNVRSFDVKALDPNAPAYGDLVGVNVTSDYYDLGYSLPLKQIAAVAETVTLPGELVTLGHEGRIPPLTTDNRIDYQMEKKFGDSGVVVGRNNLGDDSAATVRMQRVWDTWSTDYAFAPMRNIGAGSGPPFGGRPIYPSYPPPYPEPLRGIQIQIRLASPDQQMLKVITIRQDFTDKL